VVIASLVYLAIQIKQSNRHAEGAAETAWLQGLNSIWDSWADSDSTMNALRRGFGGFGRLTKNEQAIFHMRVGALVNHWLLAKQLHRKALLSSEILEQMTDVVVSVLATKGGLEYWEHDAHATPGGLELLNLVKSGDRNVPSWDQLLPWWAEDDETSLRPAE
jgi:hypothetical protein